MRFIFNMDPMEPLLCFGHFGFGMEHSVNFLVCAVPKPAPELQTITCIPEMSHVFDFDVSRKISDMCHLSRTPKGRIDYAALNLLQFFAISPVPVPLTVLGLDANDPVFGIQDCMEFKMALSLKLGEAIKNSEEHRIHYPNWQSAHEAVFGRSDEEKESTNGTKD